MKVRRVEDLESDRAILHDILGLFKSIEPGHLNCDDCGRLGTKCDHSVSQERLSLELKRKLNELHLQRSTYQDLFHLIEAATEQDGQDIIRQIKSGASAGEILKHYQNGSLRSQLALVPEDAATVRFSL